MYTVVEVPLLMRSRLCAGVLVLLLVLAVPVVHTLQGLRVDEAQTDTPRATSKLTSVGAPSVPLSMVKGDFEAHIKHHGSMVQVSLLSTAGSEGSPPQQKKDKLTWLRATNLLREDAQSGSDLRSLLTDLLRKIPYEAYFWECPPTSRSTWQSKPFEFVVIDAPYLASRRASSSSFSDYLSPYRGQPVVTNFVSLGGDADLVAPAQAGGDPDIYGHIGSFLRSAPDKQVHALWRGIGDAIKNRLERSSADEPTWVNTEGSGVPWLHVRLDSEPKYYHHEPYEAWP